MSGGSFDYAYSRVQDFADELGAKLDNWNKKTEYGDALYEFEPATLAKLREIERQARHVAALMKEAEWLYSGDTGDESFMERVRQIEAANALAQRTGAEGDRSGAATGSAAN